MKVVKGIYNEAKIFTDIVGVDIGCGMLTLELDDVEIDFEKLDGIIRKKVPLGII